MSIRDQILDSADRPIETVEVPEWGCTVQIHTMSVRQRIAWYKTSFDERGDAKDVDYFRGNLLVACLCDADGNRIFEPTDAVTLEEKKSAEIISRLYKIACRLNGIGKEETEQAEKN